MDSDNLPAVVSGSQLPKLIDDDLALSGLHSSDIQARMIGVPERSALDIPHAIPGYLIPYWDINGNPTTHYRARLFDFHSKYRQPKGRGNAVYFPERFRATLNGHRFVVITEGEKKAAAADRIGIPTVGLGGVYSWRNATITLPDTAVVTQKGILKKPGAPIDIGSSVGVSHNPQNLRIKLPSEFDGDALISEYAEGWTPLIDLILARSLTVFICFDCLPNGALKGDILKAAARLALELRFLGVPYMNIKTLPLPAGSDDYPLDKVGLDDFIVSNKSGTLHHLIDIALKAPRGSPEFKAFPFPANPNFREFVTKKLQSQKLPRRETGLLALAITADLDARGARLRSRDGLMYYFDEGAHKLVRATSPMKAGPVILDDQFSALLYRRYSLNQNDAKVLRWLTTQYTAEEPIGEVEPRRSVFTKGDALYYQINNAQFVRVTAEEISLHYNGSEGTLFQSQVAEESEIAPAALEEAINQLNTSPLTPWWYDSLLKTRLKGVQGGANSQLAIITSLLFYASPWLNKWRTSQMPVELVTGEPGSGKSTLYGLRQRILQGHEDLKNSPLNIQSWMASVLSMGGLHVIDNLSKDMDKGLKQAIADEMSRITTEPSPTIEQRRYYTEHDIVKVPAHVTFAITSLAVPFTQNDLIERSLHIAFDKGASGQDVTYDSDWAQTQLSARGGRTMWVAHHLVVLQRFFQAVKKDPSWGAHKARYRLVNFEQICMTLAQILGWGSTAPQIPQMLASMTQKTLSESDWILEGLMSYAEQARSSLSAIRGPAFLDTFMISAGDIVAWCTSQEDYQDCVPLTNARKLGRYMTAHESACLQLVGLRKAPSTVAGKQMYYLGRGPQK